MVVGRGGGKVGLEDGVDLSVRDSAVDSASELYFISQARAEGRVMEDKSMCHRCG